MLSYLAQDRQQALAGRRVIADPASGAALFADISGFTPLTESLTHAFGPRGGSERLTDQINTVYDALIVEVDRWRGAVLGFAGDAVTCWFDDADGPAAPRAAACALALQRAMAAFAALPLPDGGTVPLGLKVAVAAGPARRFVVGDPATQLIDVLAGAILARVAAGEHLTSPGEVLVDAAVAAALGPAATLGERRTADDGHQFAVLAALAAPTEPPGPWPELPAGALAAEALRPWLLPAVYERELAGHGAFLTELRPAVALFLRFEGLDYDGDPDVGTRLDSFISAVQQVFSRYEGALLQITIGDKGNYLYAAFGAPLAHEDDARRAALAAIDLQRLSHSPIAPLQIGISQGVLRCGAYGASSRRTYGVLGDPVNLAARLMAGAAPGESLVTERVAAATAASVVLEPRPPIRVKGKAEPEPVFALLDIRQSRALRLQEPAYTLPIVGRDAELALLTGAVERALGGRGQVVAVTGEAGLGKSRLIAEGVRLARQRGMGGYGGACQSTGTRSPYLVWQPIWRALFDVDPEAPLRRQVRALERLLEDWAPERVEAMPLLAALLGLQLPENDFTRSLTPRHRQSALHALLRDCLAAAATEARDEGGAILLVLEDLHWIDATSEDLLLELAAAIPTLPVLIIAAYRPPEGALPPATRLELLPGLLRIPLGAIELAAAEQLIRAKLAQLFPARGGPLPQALVAQLTAQAQGNPFFLEELLNYLRDRAVDPRDGKALGALALPDSLHRLVLSRLDGLSLRQQLAVKTASVIGRRFLVAWLVGAFPDLSMPDELRIELSALAASELTAEDTPEPELAYLFKHVVTREVAYASLPATTRAVLHGRLADHLEQATDPAEHDLILDLLAYHYEQSDDLAKKRHYLRRAGEAAAARYANAAALAYLSRAIELTPAADVAERRALLLAREAVYEVTGDRAGQAADLDALDALLTPAAEPAVRVDLMLRRGRLAALTGAFPAAAAAAEAASALAAAAGLPEQEARANRRLASALINQRAYPEARARLERSLTLARALGDRYQLCMALNDLGHLAADQGLFAEAHAAYVESLALARALGDRRQEGVTLGNLGTVAASAGDLGGARGHLEQSLALARAVGDRQMECTTLGNLAFLLSLLGDYPGARAFGDESVALARATHNRSQECYTLGTLGLVALHQGEATAARGYYEQGLAVAEAIGDALVAGFARRGLGDVALAGGDLAGAERAFGEALDTLRQLDSPAIAAEPLAGLARTALARGDTAGALGHVEPILAHLEAGTLDGAEEPMTVYLTCLHVLRAARDGRAAGLLERALGELQTQAAKIPDEPARHAFLAHVPPHRELIAAADP